MCSTFEVVRRSSSHDVNLRENRGDMATATTVHESAPIGLAETEADLTRRFDIVAQGGGLSDRIVLLGLMNAGRVRMPPTPEARRELCGRDPSIVIDGMGIDAAEFGDFQLLWYRLRVPFGAAPLYWWYLVTLALRDPARRLDDSAEALTTALEQLATRSAAERAAWLARVFGTDPTAASVVVARGDLTDTALLVEAVALGAPLVVVSGPADTDDLRAAGWVIVESRGGDLPADTLPGVAVDFAGGGAVDLDRLTARTRERWVALADDERTLIVTLLRQRLGALEQMRFTCGGDVRENASVVAVLQACSTVTPAGWSHEQLAIATLAWCWERAGFILQEFNQALLSLPLIAMFLTRRLVQYGAITGLAAAPGADVFALADELGRLRGALERSHWRCIQFDGSNWERREFLVPKALRDDLLVVPDSLAELLAARFDVEVADRSGSGAAWDAYLDALLAAKHTPTQLLCAVADWAANEDELMPIDAAIFTVPHGIKLDRPWELEIDEVFCYTAFRDGFDPRDYGMPLDFTGMRNAIGQRMRYNVVKKAQNYALVKRFAPQSFNLPDIAVAEDANHAGHRAGGIRLSMRLPAWISYHGNEWKGIADVRFNRGGYRRERRFRPTDVVIGSRFTAWEKGIADATFARDLLFDRRFCKKLTEPTEAQIAA
jgi:hypothetical protein